MRRFPTSLFLAVVLTAGIAGAARADEAVAAPAVPDATPTVPTAPVTPAEGDVVVAAADAPSAADGATPAATATATPAPAAAVVTPVLAPAASVDAAADAKKKEDKFPLGGGVSLSNSAGNGWLAPAYQVQPNWSTSLGLSGRASLPKVDFLPKLGVSTGMSLSISNWLDASTNSGVYSRQVRASDVNLGLGAGEIYKEPFTKIQIGANLSGRIPVSITSRHRNVLTTLGVGLPISWSSDEASWGSISVSFSPGARLSLYTAPATTIPCEAGVSRRDLVENPLENGLLPVAYGLESQLQADGSCILPGRQNVVGLSMPLGVGWNLGNHSVSADLGYGAGFINNVRNDPALSSQFSSRQNFSETTNGGIAYSYKVPVDFNLNISTGISSSTSPYGRVVAAPDANGDGIPDSGTQVQEPTLPFWDTFIYPANNSTSAFVDVSIGL